MMVKITATKASFNGIPAITKVKKQIKTSWNNAISAITPAGRPESVEKRIQTYTTIKIKDNKIASPAFFSVFSPIYGSMEYVCDSEMFSAPLPVQYYLNRILPLPDIPVRFFR